MEKKTRALKLFAYILILLELAGITVFAVFYFNNLYDIANIVTPNYIMIGALALVGIDVIVLWSVIISVSGLRFQTDLKAAEVIGEDVQEAYNFAMIGLVVTDENDIVI